MLTPILFKKQGQVIPKDVLETAEKNAPDTVGSARIIEGSFKIFRKTVGIDVAALMQVMDKDLRNVDVLFGLGKGKVADEDDLQPAVILEDEGDTILVAFWDGEVDIDKFQQLVELQYSQCGEDLTKTLKVLDGPALRNEIAKCWKGKGQITVMPILGETVTFRDNPKFREYGWGWASDTFEPEKQADPPQSALKGLTPQERIARKSQAASSSSKTDDDLDITKTKPTSVPGTGPQPDTKVPDGAGKEEMVTVGPPPKTIDNKGKRQWWLKRIGEIPPGYKDAIVSVPKSKLKDVEAHRPSEPVKDLKDLGKVVSASVVEVNGTVLDPKIITAIKEDFNKKNIVVQTAEQREAFKKKFPFFTAQTGIPMEEVFNWDFEMWRKMAVKFPLVAAVLGYEGIELYMEALADINELMAAPAKPAAEPEKKLTPQERIARKAAKAA